MSLGFHEARFSFQVFFHSCPSWCFGFLVVKEDGKIEAFCFPTLSVRLSVCVCDGNGDDDDNDDDNGIVAVQLLLQKSRGIELTGKM